MGLHAKFAEQVLAQIMLAAAARSVQGEAVALGPSAVLEHRAAPQSTPEQHSPIAHGSRSSWQCRAAGVGVQLCPVPCSLHTFQTILATHATTGMEAAV